MLKNKAIYVRLNNLYLEILIKKNRFKSFKQKKQEYNDPALD